MATPVTCCECQRLITEDELERGSDGRPICCCCRLKESDAKLAEKDGEERAADPVRETVRSATEVGVAPRSTPPPKPELTDWVSLY
ncbi:MAG: hypothetical protein ACE149_04520 [Armatimonadota bacterium]